MINYIKSEFYRILSKKSMYIFLGVCMLGYLLITLLRLNQITQDSIIYEANFVFSFTSILGGGLLFATIYNDDLNAKTLIPLIGYGEKRTSITLSKIIITIILMSILFIGALISFYLIFILLGYKVDFEIIKSIYPNFFLTLAYSIVASVMAYGTQKATISIVTFVLLATGFISQLLMMFLKSKMMTNLVGDLTGCTINPIVTKLTENPTLQTITPYLIYLMVFTIIAIFAFKKKELEF